MSLQLSPDGQYIIDLTTGIVTPLFLNLPFGNIIQDPATHIIPLLSTNNPLLPPLTFPPAPLPIPPLFASANGLNRVPLYTLSALSTSFPPALTPLDHILVDAFAQAAQAAWRGLQEWTDHWRRITNVKQLSPCQKQLDPPPYDHGRDPEFNGKLFLLREQTKAILSTPNILASPKPLSTHPFISSSSHDTSRPANITGQSRKRAQPQRSQRTVNHSSQQSSTGTASHALTGSMVRSTSVGVIEYRQPCHAPYSNEECDADIQITNNCMESEQSELDEDGLTSEDISPVLSPQTCLTGSNSSTIENINAETASILAAAARINLRPVQVETMMTLRDTLLERISIRERGSLHP